MVQLRECGCLPNSSHWQFNHDGREQPCQFPNLPGLEMEIRQAYAKPYRLRHEPELADCRACRAFIQYVAMLARFRRPVWGDWGPIKTVSLPPDYETYIIGGVALPGYN